MDRMKALITTETNFYQSSSDEHHTLHTKLLTDSDETDSTNVNKTDQSFCSLDDFTGGPIYSNELNDLQLEQHSCDQNTELNRSITTQPADSSCGFHNTLSVLEFHLNKNKYPNLSQHQIENLLLHGKDVAIHNNSYIDIPIDNNRRLLSVDDNFTNKKSVTCINDENFSSLFELELEVMDRLHSMWDEEIPPDHLKTSSSSADLPISSKETESNEYMYHIARSRSGQLYLRVRRDSRSDQGTFSCI